MHVLPHVLLLGKTMYLCCALPVSHCSIYHAGTGTLMLLNGNTLATILILLAVERYVSITQTMFLYQTWYLHLHADIMPSKSFLSGLDMRLTCYCTVLEIRN